MGARARTIFWSAVFISTVLLGGTVATAPRVFIGGATWAEVAVLVAMVMALASSLLIAARIVFVVIRGSAPRPGSSDNRGDADAIVQCEAKLGPRPAPR